MDQEPATQAANKVTRDVIKSTQPARSGIRTRSRALGESRENVSSENVGSNTKTSPDDNEAGAEVTAEMLATILEKEESARNSDELRILKDWSFLVPEARRLIKRKSARKAARLRNIEHEEPLENTKLKAKQLAKMITESSYIVVYTGAGISTSASIPDYRGPNGLWTQLRRVGKYSITRDCDLTNADPTPTHMAIHELCKRRLVKHVVSQNCDGLHLRSGIPQTRLSDIHGNMYIEACPTCERQYFRQADVTDRTSRFRHKTGRHCHTCREPKNNNLIDTIVLYGERSRTNWPMNWDRADKAAKKADLIICLGSSLKTLVKYHCLWPKTLKRSYNSREPETKLVVINLQGTSKDRSATLKINGKCDLVMQLVMQQLEISIPQYDRMKDPLRLLAVPFTPEERAGLRRNLLFESNDSCDEKKSQGVFVSELDSTSGQGLKMRISAVEADPDNDDGSCEPDTKQNGTETGTEAQMEVPSVKEEKESAPKKVGYALPGWLAKGLRTTKTSSYKRKRHGNKGRKHNHVLKPKQPVKSDLVKSESCDTINNSNAQDSEVS